MKYASSREKTIAEMMKKKKILTVEDLSIENLCDVFSIDVVYHPFKSQCFHEDDEDYAMIYLDSRLLFKEQRYKFFHEFGHVLSHPGNQKTLPIDFKNLQESQSHWLALYTSMPRYIFEPLAFQHQSIEKLSDLFELPETVIYERCETIKRERRRQAFHHQFERNEKIRRNKSLQPGKVYDSTLAVLQKLEKQVGRENLTHDVTRLLR